tara:strand:+ start:13947 stop:15296 length:1350 start_codon:yes stop_codon:yes gene_type:complete
MFNADSEMKKWGAVLDHEGAPAFKDQYRRAVTAKLLENTERELKAQAGVLQEDTTTVGGGRTGVGTTATGLGQSFDPILISMVRRAMPNLIAYDVAGVQPMTAPTGLIFALKARQIPAGSGNASPAQTEILFNEADTAFTSEGSTPSSDNPLINDTPARTANTGNDYNDPNYQPAGGATTATAEADTTFPEAGFSIERATVTAKTRQLKAEYSMELAQDLKAVHGLDAESELANILSAEILAEINREVIRSINFVAKIGLGNIAESGGAGSGKFSLTADADGRWLVEKFKSLVFQLEVEANKIAQETRRGKGNFVMCSSNVASALAASGSLDYTPAMSTNLNVDDTGNTFAGVLNGRMKVYVDPYAAQDYVTVGYRGTNPFDAGLFYCPYVPLTMVRAVDENSFQPKMAFKTRYGLQQHPFVGVGDGIGSGNANQYFRKFQVTDINFEG